ncbi:hypothetical protein GCM10010912_49020 [Paenibacillus albidus]|uniref:Uncharacterized protein n=1 Tax=Paenibacillus albidus TaxID=2041023 RepID=A0A917CVY9_9BACL|nr:hypothetical protein GCM10010912_49020 [Paenibacillus albidus]
MDLLLSVRGAFNRIADAHPFLLLSSFYYIEGFLINYNRFNEPEMSIHKIFNLPPLFTAD